MPPRIIIRRLIIAALAGAYLSSLTVAGMAGAQINEFLRAPLDLPAAYTDKQRAALTRLVVRLP